LANYVSLHIAKKQKHFITSGARIKILLVIAYTMFNSKHFSTI